MRIRALFVVALMCLTLVFEVRNASLVSLIKARSLASLSYLLSVSLCGAYCVRLVVVPPLKMVTLTLMAATWVSV